MLLDKCSELEEKSNFTEILLDKGEGVVPNASKYLGSPGDLKSETGRKQNNSQCD